MHLRQAAVIGAAALTLGGPAFAAPLTVGGLNWNVTVGDNNTSNFTNPSVAGSSFFNSVREDQNDNAGDGGFLGPHYGGQNYDVEFMAVALVGPRLHLLIVHGQRPDNGLARYSPGDIRIVANDGNVYGIEVGGGPGGGAGTALTEGAPGSTYTLNGSGFTTAHAATPAGQTVGSIWRNPGWIMDAITLTTPVQMRTSTGGTLIGSTDFVFTRNTFTTQHSVIEVSVPLSYFGAATELDLYWAPSCNNDTLMVEDDLTRRVPEPASLALVGLGWLGCLVARRRRP